MSWPADHNKAQSAPAWPAADDAAQWQARYRTAHGAVVEKYVTNPYPFMGLLLQAVQQGTKKFFDFQWKTNGKIFSRLSVSVTTDFS